MKRGFKLFEIETFSVSAFNLFSIFHELTLSLLSSFCVSSTFTYVI